MGSRQAEQKDLRHLANESGTLPTCFKFTAVNIRTDVCFSHVQCPNPEVCEWLWATIALLPVGREKRGSGKNCCETHVDVEGGFRVIEEVDDAAQRLHAGRLVARHLRRAHVIRARRRAIAQRHHHASTCEGN